MWLFGCWHKKTGMPITVPSGDADATEDTYVVCLDCGQQLAYSWEEMKIVKRGRQKTPGRQQQSSAD